MLKKQEIQVRYVQAAPTVAADCFLFINPAGSGEYYQVVEAVAIFDVAGGASCQADLKIVANGAQISAGTSCLGSVFNLAAGARSAVKKALADARVIAPGRSLGVDFSGATLYLSGLFIQVVLKPIRGSRRY
jgi:hypothetical protein